MGWSTIMCWSNINHLDADKKHYLDAAAGLAVPSHHAAVNEAAPKSRAATVFNTRIGVACRCSLVCGLALHCTRMQVRGNVYRGVKDASLGNEV